MEELSVRITGPGWRRVCQSRGHEKESVDSRVPVGMWRGLWGYGVDMCFCRSRSVLGRG